MGSKSSLVSKPLAVGITGGIGAGKTIVSHVFQVLGIPVYNADQRAKTLTNEDAEIRSSITETFGELAYREGLLDRQYISSVVFNDPEKLTELNAIIHPKVGKDFEDWHKAQKASYVLKEAALLFESGSYKLLDAIILVRSSAELKKSRIARRDPFRSREDIERIMANQWSDDQKLALADFVILNDESHLVIPQVLEIHSHLSS